MSWRILFVMALMVVVVGDSAGSPSAPQDRKTSPIVVTGTVEAIAETWDLEYDYYRISFRVDGVERGDGIHVGDVIVVKCFQYSRRFLNKCVSLGHRSIPDVGDRIQAFVRGKGLEGNGNYFDWYDLVEPSPRSWFLRMLDRRKVRWFVVVGSFVLSGFIVWRIVKRRRANANIGFAKTGENQTIPPSAT